MRLLSLMMVLSLAAGLPATAQSVARVTVPHAVLRYQNADDADVAGEVAAGQELPTAGVTDGAWVPVEPPPSVSFWMYAELVRNGRVAADKAQIRCGAGLTFRVVASVDQDMPVETCGRLGDWVRIRTLPGLPVWISRSAVVIEAAPPPAAGTLVLPPALANGLLAALNATNSSATTDLSAATSSMTNGASMTAATGSAARAAARPVPPPELASLTLTSEPAQGHRIRFHGVLRRTLPGATQTTAAFRLAGPDRSGGIITYCHVLGDEALFTPHVGKPVIVTGRVWWLAGEPVPVIQAVQLAEERPDETAEQKP